MRYLVAVVMFGMMAAGASAAVVVGSTESFTDGVNGGADWGVGGVDGWNSAGWTADPNNTTGHIEQFGNKTKLNQGQDPITFNLLSHSGADGTLLVQHDSNWGADLVGGYKPKPATIQINYITFQGTAGVAYSLSAWAATVYNLDPTWPSSPAADGYHPVAVAGNTPSGAIGAQFGKVEIGLKEGAYDSSDLNTAYTQVPLNYPADELKWVFGSTSLTPTASGPVTIILKFSNPDTKAAGGAGYDTDIRWDDIQLTPEPSMLALLSLGLLFIRRR